LPNLYDTIITPTNVKVEFEVLNFGEDSINAGEAFRWQIEIGGILFPNNYYRLKADLYKGSALHLASNPRVIGYFETPTYTCVSITNQYLNLNDSIDLEYSKDSNNRSCVDIYHIPTIRLSKDKVIDKKINIYPNPSAGVLNIENIPETAKISIYSLEGKLLNTFINIGPNLQYVGINNLKNGVYWLMIVDDFNIIYAEKLVKE